MNNCTPTIRSHIHLTRMTKPPSSFKRRAGAIAYETANVVAFVVLIALVSAVCMMIKTS